MKQLLVMQCAGAAVRLTRRRRWSDSCAVAPCLLCALYIHTHTHTYIHTNANCGRVCCVPYTRTHTYTHTHRTHTHTNANCGLALPCMCLTGSIVLACSLKGFPRVTPASSPNYIRILLCISMKAQRPGLPRACHSG